MPVSLALSAQTRREEMPPILKTDQDNEDLELDFELDYLLSLSAEERFQMMFRKSRELKEMLARYGHRRPFEIVKRPRR